MKNKKNVIMAVAILFAVVVLGIGYAAITSTLSITGTATAKTTNEFKVVFNGQNTNSTTDTVTGTSAVATAADDSITGTCAVTLATVGETGTCTFTFENKSPAGINAIINDANLEVYSDAAFNTVWTSTSDDYFTVTKTAGWTGEETLTPGDTQTITVTVELKKAWVDDTQDHTANFYVRLADITADQA